jgi:hypothetical protein
VGIPSERLASVASDHPVPVETAIRLSEAAAQAGLSIEQRDADLREWMAKFVIPAFLKANAVTLGAIALLAILDEGNIVTRLIAPGERIISGQVIMALLGATTVQVGTIAVIIARYLFPGRRP